MLGIGSDHLGFELKRGLCRLLQAGGVLLRDFGTHSADPVDYPDVAIRLAQAVQSARIAGGILICGTGLGMAIVANKFAGVYAAPAWTPEVARAARSSNNAQIITLGARFIELDLAQRIVQAWLGAEFHGGKSLPKINKIRRLERAVMHSERRSGVARA